MTEIAARRISECNLTKKQVLTELRIDSQQAGILLSEGILKSMDVRDSIRSLTWFAADHVADIERLLKDKISIDEMVGSTGFPAHAFDQFTSMGLLDLDRRGVLSKLYKSAHIKRTAFDVFMCQVNDATDNERPSAEGRVSLQRVFQTYGGVEKPWGPIFKAALDGTLPGGLARDKSRNSWNAKQLSVTAEAYRLLFSGTWTLAPAPSASSNIIHQIHGQEILNCSPREMAALLTQGTIKRIHPGRPDLDRMNVFRVATKYISSAEIAARLDIETAHVARWARNRGLTRRKSFPFWVRDDLEDFLYQSEQLIRTLEYRTLSRRSPVGKITRISSA